MDKDGYFGADIAAHYDDDPAMTDPATVGPAVDFLADLAGQGAALEFAIGTGRIALPLAWRGVPLSGIELSQAMVGRMRQKPGGTAIAVTIGDITKVRVPGAYALVYLVYNTINNLTTQDMQVACFQNAADHLEPGGFFVVEVGVPALQRLPLGETLVPFDRSPAHWGIDEYDVVTQCFWSHHMNIRDGQARLNSIPFRYVWPSELDLMARLAGMQLAGRYANWHRAPLTAISQSHVSVWTKVADA